MSELSEQRRGWVYEEYDKILSQRKNIPNKEKSKIYRKLWKEAKRKYK